MKARLQRVLVYGCLILLGFACSLDSDSEIVKVSQEKYELFFSYSGNADTYMRRHLVDYFQSIALVSEYGQNFPILKKWVKPMLIYVSGDPEPVLLAELDTIIAELNPLFTDGFIIQIVEDSTRANFQVFCGEKQTYNAMYPGTAYLLKENDGLFTYYLNSDYSIASGHLFVKTNDLAIRFQKHILREELTQALGLPNDIDIYRDSIFYKEWSDVQTYSNMDIEVIRLLYHPKMVPNIGAASVTSILQNILGI